jgi:ribosomal-protein-alanine N-acetyltransferase
MVREFLTKDIDDVNKLLIELGYQLEEKSFDNDFLRVLVYEENGIRGVLVYQKLIDILTIDYIVVDKKLRKKGIATKLLKSMEVMNNDVFNVTLEVKKTNFSAINFYKKNGFIEAAIRKKYYKDEDGILMIKEYR